MLRSLSERLMRELWEKDIEQRSRLERRAVRLGRLLYGIARKCTDSQLTMRAKSLVYTTLLSLVPRGELFRAQGIWGSKPA